MRAVILGAGEGGRLRPLTTYMPKVMLPVGNKPILEFIIKALVENDIRDITLVVGYHQDKIKQYFGSGSEFGARIDYAVQKKQLGTAHALYHARMDDEFLLFYGDNLVTSECVKELLKSEVNMILGSYSDRPWKYGVIEKKSNKLVKIKEKLRESEEAIVFTGMGHFDGKIFELIEERMREGIYDLPDILNEMEIKIKVISGWRDAIYPWDLLELNSYALKDTTRKLAGKIEDSTIIGDVEIGENTKIGAGSYIRGKVKIGKNCEIGPNSVILGDTSIGDGVRIGAMSYIENSIIMSNTNIGINALIKDSVIGRNVYIAPKFVTLSGKIKRIVNDEVIEVTGGAVIGDGASIGSVVIVHPGVLIGSNSNIGALKLIDKDVANGERVI